MLKKCGFTNPFHCGLTVCSYTVPSFKITHPLRAVLVTDLHSTGYGRNQEILLDAIQGQRPDLILMAGDIVDDIVPVEGSIQLLRGLKGKYPSFYVSGNHEERTGNMPAIRRMFTDYGVTVLSGDAEAVTLRGQSLLIGGVDDPQAYACSRHGEKLDGRWKTQFWSCCSRTCPDTFSILLSHRPELVKYYKNSGFDLVVAGHAHGGQVRIPGLVNGLFAPHQGFFPLFAGGRYALGTTTLIVSRGLCLNRLPRVYNPPELVVLDISPKSAGKKEDC